MFKHNKLLKRIGLFSVIAVTGSLSTILILNNVTYSNSIITTQSSRTTTTGMQAVGENDDPYPSTITGNNVLDMSSEKSGTATFDWYAIDPYSNIINLSTWGNFTVFDFKEDHNIVNPPSWFHIGQGLGNNTISWDEDATRIGHLYTFNISVDGTPPYYVNLPTTKTITSAAISVPTTLYYFDAKSSNVGKSCEIGINSDSQLNNINWTINNFDGQATKPDWVSIVNDDNNQIHVEWKPSDPQLLGTTHTFTLSATSSSVNFPLESQIITLNIVDNSHALSISAPIVSYWAEFQKTTNPNRIYRSCEISASVDGSTAQIPSLTWSITDFDHGQIPPSWMHIVNDDPTQNQIHVEWKPTEAASGPHTFTITAQSAYGSTKTTTFDLMVAHEDIQQFTFAISDFNSIGATGVSLNSGSGLCWHDIQMTKLDLNLKYDKTRLGAIDPATGEYIYKTDTEYNWFALLNDGLLVDDGAWNFEVIFHHEASDFMSFGTDAWDTTFSTGNFSPNSIGGNIYRFSDRYSAGAGHATTDFAIQLCYSSTTAHDDLGLLSKINNNLSFKVERNDDNELFRICRFNVDGRTATGSDMRIDISAPECSSDENAFPVINYYQN